MRGDYRIFGGIAMGLATALLTGSVLAQAAAPAPTNGRAAAVRQASVTTVAQTAQPGLSATTKQVEDYFNGITSLQAGFVQSVTGEKTPSSGTFSWLKPGRFLWQYEKPVAQKLVSTGSAVYFIDDRKQATQLPVNAGVARLFNAKTLNLSQQGLRATRVQSNSTMLAVEFVVDKAIKTGDNTGLTDLRLTFDRLPGNRLRLKQIDAIDTLSTTTRVEFTNVRENVSLSPKMFQYTPGVYDQRN